MPHNVHLLPRRRDGHRVPRRLAPIALAALVAGVATLPAR
jgi:hypothetical protein